jgi:transglutaminase-like putative cysteine protease
MKRLGIAVILFQLILAGSVFAGSSGTLTFTVSPAVEGTAKHVTVWLPYPMSDEYQTITGMTVSGNSPLWAVYRDPGSEAVYLKADWDSSSEKPTLTMSFHIESKDRKNNSIVYSRKDCPEMVKPYLEATEFVPANDPEMKKLAKKATKGKSGILEKARGIYDWVVENTYRDPDVKGCGLGLPVRTMMQCKGGGKCADLSSVFVTLARAAGIPARDVYGIRLATPADGDVTSAYHCWAEFYLPGTGWVMVDPADVRKMMLVNKLELKDAGEWRKKFWGGDDLLRVVLEKNARGLALDGAAQNARQNYFMYPAAQVDGKMLDYFDPESFKYSVTFKKD